MRDRRARKIINKIWKLVLKATQCQPTSAIPATYPAHNLSIKLLSVVRIEAGENWPREWEGVGGRRKICKCNWCGVIVVVVVVAVVHLSDTSNIICRIIAHHLLFRMQIVHIVLHISMLNSIIIATERRPPTDTHDHNRSFKHLTRRLSLLSSLYFAPHISPHSTWYRYLSCRVVWPSLISIRSRMEREKKKPNETSNSTFYSAHMNLTIENWIR